MKGERQKRRDERRERGEERREKRRDERRERRGDIYALSTNIVTYLFLFMYYALATPFHLNAMPIKLYFILFI